MVQVVVVVIHRVVLEILGVAGAIAFSTATTMRGL
jgi:hypothetical protein